jgi:hypothetical protein
LPCTASLPPSANTGFASLQANFDLTGNKGNMVIGESVARIFECNRAESCYFDPVALLAAGWSPQRISDAVRERFDLVVLAMANAVRPDYDPGAFTDFVEALQTDCVVLGLGKQKAMPVRADSLRPGMQRLLRMFDERAKLLGVRGFETEHWLQGIGIGRARALGCPSMFVYPGNILSLTPPEPHADGPVVTAGHIHQKSPRTAALLQLLRGVPAHYVMQDEIFHLGSRFARWRDFYNDATGQVDTALAGRIFGEILGADPALAGYWYFQDVPAWRVFCSRFRLFVGDRFHGAVAAMQAGVPALVVRDDLRVAELTEFFGIPNLPITELGQARLSEAIAAELSPECFARFHATYGQRLAGFLAALRELGIPLAIGEPAAGPGPQRDPAAKGDGLAGKVGGLLRAWVGR